MLFRAAALEGGAVAGVAREELEKRSGEKVVSGENYLTNLEGRKRVDGKRSMRA